jgi:CheY-like chemotaxis protein
VNQTSSSQPTILVVEDLAEIRSGMERTLRDCGYRVLAAADADEAVEVASRDIVDLILTEEELPTFTALLERACEHPSLKGLPVVIVNPDAEEGTRYADAIVLTDYDQLKRLLFNPERAQRFS